MKRGWEGGKDEERVEGRDGWMKRGRMGGRV